MSTSLVRYILLASIATTVAAQANSAAPVAGAPTPAPAPPVPPYELKKRSSFTPVTDENRAPFWPIGWVKRKPVSVASAEPTRVVEAPKVVLDPSSFKLTSILLGQPALAIINGRTYSEGEFIKTPRPTGAAALVATAPAARVRVYRINDGAVILQCQEQLVKVALQRPELAQRRAEEQLLLEDRP